MTRTIERVQRQFPGDWEPGEMPANIDIDDTAYVHTTFAFDLCRSEQLPAVSLARGSQANDGTMFDIGPNGRVAIGECSLLTSVWFLCDREITIGTHTMISWSVMIMDTYRVPRDLHRRREALGRLARQPVRKLDADDGARPVRIGDNVWIGFESCILPGVTIGNGSIVGARSVVDQDVEPYTVVAGNPARVVRRLVRPEGFQ